jgi:O-antigen ligase
LTTETGIREKILFVILLSICFLIPLAVTTYLNNQSDLFKNALLQALGGFFVILTVIFSFFTVLRNKKSIKLLQFNSAIDPYIILFLIAAIVTTVFSLNPEVSFYGQYERQIGLITIIMAGLLYYYSRVVLADESRLRKIIFGMETAAVLVAVYSFLQKSGMDPFDIQPIGISRPVSTLGNAVFAGGFLAIVLPLSILNVSLKKNVILRVLFPVLILAGIIVTGTRSAYLAVFFGLAAAAMIYVFSERTKGSIKKLKKPFIAAGIIFAVVVMLVFLFPENQFVQRFLSIFSAGDNTRIYLWRDSFNIFLNYPLFGTGIGMFPNALEGYYSVRLKTDEILKVFDNAHNNFLHILCTMGITGLITYLLLIGAGLNASLRGFFSKENDRDKKILFLSFFAVLISYSVYGLTNFDDISILLYLFLIFGMFGSITLKSKTGSNLKTAAQKLRGYALNILIVIFCVFCIYNSFRLVLADRYYLEGVKAFEVNDIRGTISQMNNAVYLNPACAYYRFGLALRVYSWAAMRGSTNIESKNIMLLQAEQEMLRARKNFISKKECDAVLAMINYELGDMLKADSIKNGILSKDPISINFRLRLIEYYLKNDKIQDAKENLDAIGGTGYESAAVWNSWGYYYLKTNEHEKAEIFFGRVLALDPGNIFAKEMLGKIQK